MRYPIQVAFLIAGSALWAQPGGTPIRIAFSDPARPKTVRADTMNGGLTVTGYDGQDVEIEARGRSGRVPRAAEGLKRIDVSGGSITAEEENNTIRIHAPVNGNLVVRVPRATSLKLQTTNGHELRVENVTGDLELSASNANVVAMNVSGSVVANSANGRILVTVDRVAPDKPMSFSTMNGNIDVTFPADIRANLKMRTDNGDAFTDFDMNLKPAESAMVQDGRAKGGKYRVRMERTTTGAINGGGPEISFRTLNGNLYIRKKK